jgi:hypothetical protein
MSAIVAVSDLHLDHVTYGVPRFDEGAAVLRASVERAVAIDAAAWVFLGDLCDPDSGPVVFRCVKAMLLAALALRDAGIPAVFLAGNHDVIEDGSGSTTICPLRADRNARVFEEPGVVKLPGLPRIVAFPFTASAFGYDAERWAADHVERGEPCITISHLSVPGIVPGEETTEMPRGREVTFPIARTSRAVARLQGHYHRAQDVDTRDGGAPIHVVGSPARLTFGEERNAPGFLVLEIS